MLLWVTREITFYLCLVLPGRGQTSHHCQDRWEGHSAARLVRGSPSAGALAAVLRAGVPLLELHLGWNSIRGAAAQDLAEAALTAPALERFCHTPLAELRAGQKELLQQTLNGR